MPSARITVTGRFEPWASRARRPENEHVTRTPGPARSQPPCYFLGSGAGAGLACTDVNGDAAGVCLGLFCLGFFGSRPLRF